MSTNAYVKFVTEEVVKFLNSPKDERKGRRGGEKQVFHDRWFGLLPFTFKLLLKRR